MEESEAVDEVNPLLPCKKKETFTKQKQILVEVVEKKRTGKCFGKPKCFIIEKPKNTETTKVDAPTTTAYNDIHYDIWFHISKQIQPEDVKTFSMLCTQTARIVNTKKFWLHLYRKFCANGGRQKRITALPPNLQPNVIEKLSKSEIRQCVLQSLFVCYAPFQDRLRKEYSLDLLHGQFYVSSWYFQSGCIWIISYKFVRTLRSPSKGKPELSSIQPVVDDWETLATENDDNNNDQSSELRQSLCDHNPNEGVSLLLIMTKNYTPVPTELLQHSIDTAYRLEANRNLLDKNMRLTNLELDFIDKVNKNKITIKHNNLTKYKVLPWWHPDFKVFVK